MTNRSRARIALRVVWALVGLLALALLVALVVASVRLNGQNDDLADRVDQSDAQREAIEDKLADQAAAAEALELQLRRLGEDPIVVPENVPDAPLLIEGPRGLSCIEEIGYARCRGDEGRPGDEGTEGDAGTDGVDGQPGTDGKDGVDGAPGKDGVDGKDGRGIDKTYCNDAGRWEITYSDGTTEDGGVCRVAPGNPNELARR